MRFITLLKEQITAICSAFAFSTFLHLFFTFKLYSFCWRGAQECILPRAQNTLATPLATT